MSSVNLEVNRPVFSLPANLPTGYKCFQVMVPDDPYYTAQFVGSIERLAWWFNYDRDNARTGRLVANLWKVSLASITECKPAPPPEPGCCDCEECMQFRQQGCLLQAWDCLTQEWVTIYDNSQCISNPAPGGGVTPPSAGKCQEYKMNFFANALTPLPFVVNAGDTLTLVTLEGAGSDGTLHYYCPDGQHFIAGTCAGGAFLQSTDPLPTNYHMSVLLYIGSTYYSWYSGVFTVPSGVVNEPIYIGVNDSPIADNNGTYAVDFNYCNNVAPPVGTWCHKSDFTVSPDGWTAPGFNESGGTCETGLLPSGLWSSAGYAGQLYHQADCTDLAVVEYIQLDLGSSVPITSVIVNFNLETAAHPSDEIAVYGSNSPGQSGGGTTLGSVTNPGTGPKVLTCSASASYRYIKIYGQKLQGAGTSPTATVTSVEIQGNGPNPLGTSNC